MTQETLYALTSLSPSPQSIPAQRSCIESWRAAGLEVRAFNHPDEIRLLRPLLDVDFVPVEATSMAVFGKPYVPIKTLLDWAAAQDAPALLINADIELRLTPQELKRIRWLSHGGLCYFVRHNHDGDLRRATREPYGIDAFLLHGRDATLFADSFLSMGKPYWDYWLPHVISAHGRPIFAVEHAVAFHRNHSRQWSWEEWLRCAHEFARISGLPQGDGSLEACVGMAAQVRQSFDHRRQVIAQRAQPIREWLQRSFRYRGAKTMLELGAHCGTDTHWLASLPDVRLFAFEPDPRNNPLQRGNVTIYRSAISDRDGSAPFILSATGWGQVWTHSSSLKQPKNHLLRYPVTFGEPIEVHTVRLDTFSARQGLGVVDFIWADIQGAEGEMIRGGRETLARTRYLYTEYSDDELYEGQVTLRQILEMLPSYRVRELWPDDVLLENTRVHRCA